MDYTQLAAWTGWPPIVGALLLIGAIGAFFFAQRDVSRLALIDSLKQQLKHHEETTPDILVARLLQRREALETELKTAGDHDAQRLAEVERLNLELENTKLEARLLDRQLQEAQRDLSDLILPRDGKVRQSLAFDILRYVDTQQAIFVPIRTGPTVFGDADRELISSYRDGPRELVLRTYFAGMFRTYLRVTTGDRKLLGQVECPYPDTYDRDYYETLLAILPFLLHEELPIQDEVRLGDNGDLTSALRFPDVTFQGYSPIDSGLGYFRLSFRGTYDSLMSALTAKYEYQGGWYQLFNGYSEPVG